MSYRKYHVKTKINRIKPKKRFYRKLWFWVSILFIAAGCSAVYFIFFYPGFQIQDIVISGNEKAETQSLRQAVLNGVETGLINFLDIKITSRSIFLVNTDKLNDDILKEYPVIEKININKNFPRTIIVGVAERKPVGIYCAGKNSYDRCFLIDQNGVIFEPVSASKESFSIIRQSVESGEIFTGERVVQENIMDAVAKVHKNLTENLKIDIKEAFISSPMRLNVKTGENWQIYFNLDPNFDINLQLVKLDLMLKEGMSEQSRQNLRYIDLRTKDRAVMCDNDTCDN